MLRLGYRKLSYLFLILSALMYAFIMMPEEEVVEIEETRVVEPIKEELVFERLSPLGLSTLSFDETSYRARFNAGGEKFYEIITILGSFKRAVKVENFDLNSSDTSIILKFKFLD